MLGHIMADRYSFSLTTFSPRFVVMYSLQVILIDTNTLSTVASSYK